MVALLCFMPTDMTRGTCSMKKMGSETTKEAIPSQY